VDVVDGSLVIPSCNAKLRRNLSSTTAVTVVTLQSGAFGLDDEPAGSPVLEKVDVEATRGPEFAGYEVADKTGVDLTKAQIIVSAGRGIGKAENLEIVALLAAALGGEYGASRPVVDAGWADHNRQVGTTGQSVAPKLYVACGISGAIQHLAGMKKSDFVIAVNTDKDAPIGEVADVLAVADVKQLLPALTERLNSL
jgi:electron transfer flavoprotein alpha subunit